MMSNVECGVEWNGCRLSPVLHCVEHEPPRVNEMFVSRHPRLDQAVLSQWQIQQGVGLPAEIGIRCRWIPSICLRKSVSRPWWDQSQLAHLVQRETQGRDSWVPAPRWAPHVAARKLGPVVIYLLFCQQRRILTKNAIKLQFLYWRWISQRIEMQKESKLHFQSVNRHVLIWKRRR